MTDDLGDRMKQYERTPFARACRALVELQRGDPVNDFVWDTIWNERHKTLDDWPVAQAVMVVLKALGANADMRRPPCQSTPDQR